MKLSQIISAALMLFAIYNFSVVTSLYSGIKQNNPSVIPESLKKLKDTHPRLYLTPASQIELKKKMSSELYSTLLGKLIILADKLAESGPPVFRPANSRDDEQLWQRNVGNAIPELSMAYLMTGNKKYSESAKAWMLASASYPTWGTGTYNNSDLATGHQLFGMALGYDWLYDVLDATSRDSIRNCLVKRGSRLYDLLVNDRIYWTKTDLQNHQYINMTGLCTAGLALYGGKEEVSAWIMLPLEKYKKSISALQPDGANHEGIPYWGYAVEYLLKFMDLSRDLLGMDFYSNSTFFKNTASFRIYGMIPKNFWEVSGSRLMTLGDSPRSDWYGPDYILRKLASEYKDGYAQWLAQEMDDAGYCTPQGSYLNLLWMNPGIKAAPPNKLPTSKHFNDLDIVYMRSGWDGKESLCLFKCGPFIGHSAIKLYSYDPGGGHVHPDVGTFQIFSNGDWLISDDGYTFKRTIYQNTLVINGVGQTGENRMWFSGRNLMGPAEQPKIVYSMITDDYNYFIGNAKPAYPDSSRLKLFYRHLLYLKPNCWIIADEVEAEKKSLFEFYYHSDFPFYPDGENSSKVQGTRGSLKFTTLKPSDAERNLFLQDIQSTSGRITSKLNVLKLSSSGQTKDLFLSILETFPTEQNPVIKPSVKSSPEGEILLLDMGKITKRFRILTERNDKNTPLLVETK